MRPAETVNTCISGFLLFRKTRLNGKNRSQTFDSSVIKYGTKQQMSTFENKITLLQLHLNLIYPNLS